MRFHSDDILDCVGFLWADILPLLEGAGIAIPGELPRQTEPPCAAWPDWKLRLAAADYLTDLEAAASLEGVDISASGWLSDDVQAALSHRHDIIRRACIAGSLDADPEGAEIINGRGEPKTWSITPKALAAWCASRNPPIPYPLPGNPLAAMPTTDAGLREALSASEKERAEWKAKAETLEQERRQHSDLEAEIDRIKAELMEKTKELAAMTAERDAMKGEILNGKARGTALQIIGGLVKEAYRIDIHASRLNGLKDILDDLRKAGADIGEQALSGWIKEASGRLPKESKSR